MLGHILIAGWATGPPSIPQSKEACPFPSVNATAKLSLREAKFVQRAGPVAMTSWVHASFYRLPAELRLEFKARHVSLGWPSIINAQLQESGWNGCYAFCGNQYSIYSPLLTYLKIAFVLYGWYYRGTDFLPETGYRHGALMSSSHPVFFSAKQLMKQGTALSSHLSQRLRLQTYLDNY